MKVTKEIEQKYNLAEPVIQKAQLDHGGVYIEKLVGKSDVEFEVDVGLGEIAFSITVDKSEYAEECAYSKLACFLQSKGVHVYKNYCERGCDFCPCK